MISKTKRLLALGISFLVLGTSFSGCGKTTTSGEVEKSTAAATTTTSKLATYPISGNPTLKVWMAMTSNMARVAKNQGDTSGAKELEKKTGVKVEYIHPTIGSDNEKTAFNLMVASGDLPDIIEWNWINNYPGGPENAIANKVITKLNDILPKFSPNLNAYLNGNPEINKMAKTDNGSYFMYPFIRGDASLMVFQGPIIRNDYLKEVNLPIPTTIDEWYTTLKAFKEKKNLEAPIAFQGFKDGRGAFKDGGAFIGAFGVKREFYLDNGKVKYGPNEPGYKEFLTTMRKWYSEGLIDKNFASADLKAMNALMTGGKAGATYGLAGSSLGTWQTTASATDPKVDFEPAPFPTLKKGDKPLFGHRDIAVSNSATAAITTKCKNVEVAAKWLDYGYSKEGEMLYNFGIEGESYKMVNNYPTYQEIITKNPNKYTIGQAIALYARSSAQGPFVQRKEYIEQYMELPAQKQALKVWADTDAVKVNMPPVTPTAAESAEFAKIMNDVNTFVDEMSIKYILGNESLDNYSKFSEQLKKLNIDQAIKINQAALDRFNKR